MNNNKYFNQYKNINPLFYISIYYFKFFKRYLCLCLHSVANSFRLFKVAIFGLHMIKYFFTDTHIAFFCLEVCKTLLIVTTLSQRCVPTGKHSIKVDTATNFIMIPQPNIRKTKVKMANETEEEILHGSTPLIVTMYPLMSENVFSKS